MAEHGERIVSLEVKVEHLQLQLAETADIVNKLASTIAAEKERVTEERGFQKGALWVGYAVLWAAVGLLTYLATYLPGLVKYLVPASRAGS